MRRVSNGVVSTIAGVAGQRSLTGIVVDGTLATQAQLSFPSGLAVSGNFLVIAYKEMRAIEAEINKRRGEADRRSVIPLTNFRSPSNSDDTNANPGGVAFLDLRFRASGSSTKERAVR